MIGSENYIYRESTYIPLECGNMTSTITNIARSLARGPRGYRGSSKPVFGSAGLPKKGSYPEGMSLEDLSNETAGPMSIKFGKEEGPTYMSRINPRINRRYNGDNESSRFATAYERLLAVAKSWGVPVYQLTSDEMRKNGYADDHGPTLGWRGITRYGDSIFIDRTTDPRTMAITLAHELGAGRGHKNSDREAQLSAAELLAQLGYDDLSREAIVAGKERGYF